MITILFLETPNDCPADELLFTADPDYNIMTASSIDSAIDLAVRHAALIDVAVLDVDLGNGVTSIDTAQEIFTDSGIPVIFQLNTTNHEHIASILGTQALGCIDKKSSDYIKKTTILSTLRFHHIKPKSGKWAHLFNPPEWELSLGTADGAALQSIDEIKKINSILYATLDSIDEGILVVDRIGVISDLNKRFVTMWNIPETLVADRDDKDLLAYVLNQVSFPDAFLKKVEYYYSHPEMSGTDIIELTNGKRYERYSQPQQMDGEIAGRVWSFRDVTERKIAEDALKRSERLLRESQEVAKIGYFVTDIATGKWESSPVLNHIFGIDESFEHEGEFWNALIAPQFRQMTLDHYFLTIRDKGHYHIDYQIIRPSDGEARWVSAIGELDVDESGVPIRMIGTVQDITERKLLEQQLLQSQKLEGIGALAGGIAHDFNNLLALILGSAELLQGHLGDQPGMKKYVDRIIEASERGTSISRQLLLFSRPEQAVLQPISLSHTISELRDMLKHFLPKSIAIETSIEVDEGIILGDSGQIHQALLNLSLNAGDAMTNSGTLTLREFNVDAEFMEKSFGPVPHASYVAVAVTDTGTGMTPAVLEKIFDPFFTTKQQGKGTGLGLGIVHGIMKNHQGFIGVESAPGKGTTFTLYFPLSPFQESETAEPHPAPVKNHSGTILIVDDEDLIREMLCESLTDAGYTVLTASNGTQALEMYSAHSDGIDLIITDLGMPEMGGEELFKRLKLVNPDVKAMVSSGYLEGITKEHFLQLGIKAVLTKPFKLREIHDAICVVLGE